MPLISVLNAMHTQQQLRPSTLQQWSHISRSVVTCCLAYCRRARVFIIHTKCDNQSPAHYFNLCWHAQRPPSDLPASYSSSVADAMAASEATGCGAVHCPERLVPRLRRRGDHLYSPFIPSWSRVFRPSRQNGPCLELAATLTAIYHDPPQLQGKFQGIIQRRRAPRSHPFLLRLQRPSGQATDPLVSENRTLDKPKLSPQLFAAQALHATT